ncbi:hypothetical protein ABZ626_12245 [Streptomyces longispororuber]|uniref:hypothetical protein n=1 Tax=Streptomyces longispororuber TaxID=68230 RepID=UPI0033FF9AB9
MSVATVHAQVEPGHVTVDKKYLYSGTGAVGKGKDCVDPTHPDQVLYTVVQSYAAGRDDAATMKKLITAYTTAVERSTACRPGQSGKR